MRDLMRAAVGSASLACPVGAGLSGAASFCSQLNSLRKGRVGVVAAFCLIVFGLLPSVGVAADSYEDMLEAEAQAEAQLDAQAQASAGKSDANEAASAPEPGVEVKDSADGVSRSAFEGRLKDGFTGTYRFYQKLGDAQRQQVLDSYRQTKDMNAVSALVIKLYRSR